MIIEYKNLTDKIGFRVKGQRKFYYVVFDESGSIDPWAIADAIAASAGIQIEEFVEVE